VALLSSPMRSFSVSGDAVERERVAPLLAIGANMWS